ncbi:MAG: PD40 domain-containing protein [Anaerolineae bacterium]|nr:PD40 domain-containing protein [Anaerolineae bacterium]
MAGTLDRLDRAAIAAIVILILAIAGTVAAGDRAGVGVQIAELSAVSPAILRTTTPLRLDFSEQMNTDSAAAALQITPATEGTISWLGTQLIFKPKAAWLANTEYTVSVNEGATSQSGRKLLQTASWTFTVRPAQVVYLAPALQEASLEPPNLWLVSPDDSTNPRQLTNEPRGVVNFRTSPDGTMVAYAAKTADQTTDLFVITVDSGETRRLTRCVEAICQSPDWNPDGTRIVYERIEQNRNIPALDQGAARAWIVNLRDLSTAPLFQESQFLGAVPYWSPDGRRIVFYDRNYNYMSVIDLQTGDRQDIVTLGADSGEYRIDPTGQYLVYPDIVMVGTQFATEMWLADFDAHSLQTLAGGTSDNPVPVRDTSPTWNPANGTLAVARLYLDGSGPATPQVYEIDPKTLEVKALFVDPLYFHTAISWSPDGNRLVMMRRRADQPDPIPGIWVYDRTTATVWQLVSDAYLPQWLP